MLNLGLFCYWDNKNTKTGPHLPPTQTHAGIQTTALKRSFHHFLCCFLFQTDFEETVQHFLKDIEMSKAEHPRWVGRILYMSASTRRSYNLVLDYFGAAIAPAGACKHLRLIFRCLKVWKVPLMSQIVKEALYNCQAYHDPSCIYTLTS